MAEQQPKNITISCYDAEEEFSKINPLDKPKCVNGWLDIRFLKDYNAIIETGNRAYQREQVAPDSWKQEIMRTVLVDSYAGVPEVHFRVISPKEPDGALTFEVIDGQQRVTAILDFLNGAYTLGAEMKVGKKDISGMTITELRSSNPKIWEKLVEYPISCKWYTNLSSRLTASLFIKVLNNVNDMKWQEKRNAVVGPYSDYVRESARKDGAILHDLFTRTTTTVRDKEKTILKYFSQGFTLANRMEVDEFLSELLYLNYHGIEKGISHAKHRTWVEDIQKPEGDYASSFTDKKKADELLNFALSIVKAVPNEFKVKLNSMTTIVLILYAKKMCKRFGDVNPKKYTKAFFETHLLWSDTSKQLYRNETMAINDNQMPPFNELFGGKNPNAIQTIFKVLDKERENGDIDFGIIKLDLRKTFKRSDIVRKWQEQGGKCAITGVELALNDIAGDHIVARSAGLKAGGVTEYDNLQVIGKLDNIKKSNMSNEVYKEKIA